MTTLLLLAIFAPLVFCAYDYSSELTAEDLREIYELKELTDQHVLLNKPFEKSNASYSDVIEDDVGFWVYSQMDPNGTQVLFNQTDEIDKVSSFRTSVQTKVIIHGWKNNKTSPVNTLLKNAFLGKEDVNIIVVEWKDLAGQLYTISAAAVNEVGVFVGRFLKNLSSHLNYPLENIVLIGHSLGAHAAGFAGKETKAKVRAIIGLDPAGPGFLVIDFNRLTAKDAQYVMVIHTCGKVLGVQYNLGQADFWPNGGYIQNGCGLDAAGTCSHSRAYEYLAESINSAPSNDFISLQCSTSLAYQTGLCNRNQKAPMGGLYLNTSITGSYYLDTNSESPFAKGWDQ